MTEPVYYVTVKKILVGSFMGYNPAVHFGRGPDGKADVRACDSRICPDIKSAIAAVEGENMMKLIGQTRRVARIRRILAGG